MAEPALGISVFGVPFLFAQNGSVRPGPTQTSLASAGSIRDTPTAEPTLLSAEGRSAGRLVFPRASGLPLFSPTLVGTGTVSRATAANFDQAVQNLQRASNLLNATSRFAVTV